MHETLRFTIQGVVPTILCNGQTSDPLNKFAKALKKITSKKNKTEEDHKEMAKLEFMACMYVDEKGHPCWPSDNLEAMIIKAAAKSRKGTDAKSAVFIESHAPLMYDGPKTPEALWKHRTMDANPFVLRASVVVNRNRVMRTRPIFRDWALQFDVHFLIDMFERDQVIDILETAGRVIGLSDWRPKYGRFNVVKAESITYEEGNKNGEEKEQPEEKVDGEEVSTEGQGVLEEVSS